MNKSQIYQKGEEEFTRQLLIKSLMRTSTLVLLPIMLSLIYAPFTWGHILIVVGGSILFLVSNLSWVIYQMREAPCDLADWQIYDLRNSGIVEPFDIELIEPNSYDVRLGTKYGKILPSGDMEEFEAEETILEPGEFLLAHTVESFSFPNNIKGILQGKSSWARLAVFVEAAGLFDSGFKGTAVLELYNCGKHAVKLRKNEKIAQMSFHRSLPAALPYGEDRGSHYQGQEGAKSSWIGKGDRIVPRPE